MTLPPSTLDTILTLQLTVAWAGEASCVPPRLGWWRTDLVDEAGGGDLLRRLLPRTYRWAALEAVREAARRADAAARAQLPDPDAARTLFSLGFELDEQVAERLAACKAEEGLPEEALDFAVDLAVPFDAELLAVALRRPDAPGHTVVPGGRRLKGAMPDSPELAVRNLAASLLPFADQYPMPYYSVR